MLDLESFVSPPHRRIHGKQRRKTNPVAATIDTRSIKSSFMVGSGRDFYTSSARQWAFLCIFAIAIAGCDSGAIETPALLESTPQKPAPLKMPERVVSRFEYGHSMSRLSCEVRHSEPSWSFMVLEEGMHEEADGNLALLMTSSDGNPFIFVIMDKEGGYISRVHSSLPAFKSTEVVPHKGRWIRSFFNNTGGCFRGNSCDAWRYLDGEMEILE